MLRPCRGSVARRVARLERVDAGRDVGLRFELIDVLREALAVGRALPIVVEHDDADVAAVAAVVGSGPRRAADPGARRTGASHRARCQPFVAAIVLATSFAPQADGTLPPPVAQRDVVHVPTRPRDQVVRRLEDLDEAPFPIEGVERRPVLVGDEEVAGARIDHQPLGIEAAAERCPRSHSGRAD